MKRSILLLGSGGLSIGQAGEFDYSGTQAIRSLLSEGFRVIVVNPNIATVQTDPQDDVKVFLYPVEPHWVERVIAQERPWGLAAGFGGQTGLNCAMELDKRGVLRRYGVKNLGTPIATLRMTEDRGLFAKHMRQIGVPVPPSKAVHSVDEALRTAERIGYPVIVRAAYALGGLGSGFAHGADELRSLAGAAFANSPQVLVEKSLVGWREVEYEVMRDASGDAITICNMENLDPLGIHTGDSVVVAPSQTLDDTEYQRLRDESLKIARSVGIVGECNVQFALDPASDSHYVIEINARLSRSSALASKASGYPIAAVAAKVILGKRLIDLPNPVTGVTKALYEPAFDYVTVKIPRWDLNKFSGVSRSLGSMMKSVGEVMAVGRTLPEALQKGVRMVTEDPRGLSRPHPKMGASELSSALREATDTRLFSLLEAFRRKMSVAEVQKLSKVDPWFLRHFERLAAAELEIKAADLARVTAETWRDWKTLGFGDEQIAALRLGPAAAPSAVEAASLKVRAQRERKGVRPYAKRIDTTAAEYPSKTNYLYMSYAASEHDLKPSAGKKAGLILGSGSYRIGTSVEFDWCAVRCSERMRKSGWTSVILNCNPETVSTDFDLSDRLYFEEPTLERVLDVARFERVAGAVVSMGGQLPNKLAKSLHRAGVRLLGHSAESVDAAEDRGKFSALLDRIGVDQPRWTAAASRSEVREFVRAVGFPVLVRPSYVLSGAAMRVAHDEKSLALSLAAAADVSAEHPVVISEFLQGAREIELDGVARKGRIVASVLSEHVENAGVHSGDATLVIPAQKLYVETVRQVRLAGARIVRELELNGPFNIQFLARDNRIRVIECNARASRSFPFASKVLGVNLADLATRVMLGQEPKVAGASRREDELGHVGVKAALFSFKRLSGSDPVLGVEMSSTGEVGCIGRDFDEALLLALEASHVKAPKRGLLVSAGPEAEKLRFLSAAAWLKSRGIPVYATEGTARFLKAHGVEAESLAWPGGGKNDVLAAIKDGRVDFVINIPKSLQTRELVFGRQIRQMAIRFGCSLLTDMEKARDYFQALERAEERLAKAPLLSVPPYAAE